MPTAASISEAAVSLYTGRRRTLLALMCIIIGTGSVIAMITVGTIVKNESLENFKELGTDVFKIRKLRDRTSESAAQTVIRLSDVENMVAQVPSVTAAAPWIKDHGEIAYAGRRYSRNSIMGVTPAFADLQKLRVAEGRFLSSLDFRRNYCVIGHTLAGLLRRTGADTVVGERIKAGGNMYTVVGVLDDTPRRGYMDLDVNRLVLVPISTAERVFNNSDITEIMARRHPDLHHTVVESDVKAYFRSKSRFMRVAIESASKLIEHMQAQLQLITLMLGAAGSIALIIGGASVMNVMLAAVTERRNEIGIRRALGARRRDIQNQFLIEAIMLSLAGSALGIGLGVGGSYALCEYTDWNFMISPGAIALGVGVASGVGSTFGFYPAWQAARLDPVSAMRAQ